MKVDTLIRAVGGLTGQEKGAWIADGRIIPWQAAGREVLGGLWQELVPPHLPRYATSLGMFHTHPLDQVPELSDEDRFFVFANNIDWQCVATGKGHVCECYKKGYEYRQVSEIAKKIIYGEYDMDILGQKFREFESLRSKVTATNPQGIAEKKTVYLAGMPEAVKDNRARIQELGNMLREGGYGVTGREKSILTSNMRIHISANPIKLYKKSYVQETGPKPNGFWYAFGTDWINELLITKIPKQKCGYIYKVDTNNSNILQIKTHFEINKFIQEYGLNKDFTLRSVNHIDWIKVAHKYDGIEINLPAEEALPKLRWYYGWDVASGCVWNLDKVKIELIGTLKDNIVRVQYHTTTEREQKEPWQMTRGEFAKTAVPLPDRKDFIKAWLKDNEDIPDLVKPGFNYIEQRNGSLLVFGNKGGHAIGIISMRKDVVEHIAVSDRYKDKGIATQLLEESRKYGVRSIIGAISPEVAGIVHRFTVRTAFLEGKPVPQEVLREYPDLVVKAEKQKWRKSI